MIIIVNKKTRKKLIFQCPLCSKLISVQDEYCNEIKIYTHEDAIKEGFLYLHAQYKEVTDEFYVCSKHAKYFLDMLNIKESK